MLGGTGLTPLAHGLSDIYIKDHDFFNLACKSVAKNRVQKGGTNFSCLG